MVEVDKALLFDKRYQEARRTFGDRWFTLSDLVGHGILHDSKQGEWFCSQMRTSKYAEVEFVSVAPMVYRYRFRQAESAKPEVVKTLPILWLVPKVEELPGSVQSEAESLPEIPEFKYQSSLQYRHLCLRIVARFGKETMAMTADIRGVMYAQHPERASDPKRRLGATLAELAQAGLLKAWGERRGRHYSLTDLAIEQIHNWGPLDEGIAEIWRRVEVNEFAHHAARTLCKTAYKEAQSREEYLAILDKIRSLLDIERSVSKVRPFSK